MYTTISGRLASSAVPEEDSKVSQQRKRMRKHDERKKARGNTLLLFDRQEMLLSH